MRTTDADPHDIFLQTGKVYFLIKVKKSKKRCVLRCRDADSKFRGPHVVGISNRAVRLRMRKAASSRRKQTICSFLALSDSVVVFSYALLTISILLHKYGDEKAQRRR